MKRYLLYTLLVALGTFCLGSNSAAQDLTAWEALPVLEEGRVMPLETFARRVVTTVCGSANPKIVSPYTGKIQKFSASELLLCWLADPEKWRDAKMLRIRNPSLQEKFSPNDRLASLTQLKDENFSEEYNQLSKQHLLREALLKELKERRKAGQSTLEAREWTAFSAPPQPFRQSELEKLHKAYELISKLLATPNNPEDQEKFLVDAKNNNVAFLESLQLLRERINEHLIFASSQFLPEAEFEKMMKGNQQALRENLVDVLRVVPQLEESEDFRLIFNRIDELAAELATGFHVAGSEEDPSLPAIADAMAGFARLANLAIYDLGTGPHIVPSLNRAALEERRLTSDNSPAWLSIQVLTRGSKKLLAAYPQKELAAVQASWSSVTKATKAFYSSPEDADKRQVLQEVMKEFSENVQKFAEKIEVDRQKLPFRSRNEEILTLTSHTEAATLASVKAESFYNSLDPFRWAWILLATAGILAALSYLPINKNATNNLVGYSLLLVAGACIFLGLAFYLRYAITGYLPMSNFFEMLTFTSLAAALFGLTFTLWPASQRQKKEGLTYWQTIHSRRFILIASALAGALLVWLTREVTSSKWSPEINLPMTVLRDNLFMGFHVIAIVISFASALVAFLLSFVVLFLFLFGFYHQEERGVRQPKSIRPVAKFVYHSLQITVLSLMIGNLLGAIWGDYSWGRFWAWDNKEVWTLITLFVYLAFLHGCHCGWIRDWGLACGGIFGFASIVWTGVGVNYFMKSANHSYGSGEKSVVMAAILISMLGVSLLLLLAAKVTHLIRTQAIEDGNS